MKYAFNKNNGRVHQVEVFTNKSGEQICRYENEDGIECFMNAAELGQTFDTREEALAHQLTVLPKWKEIEKVFNMFRFMEDNEELERRYLNECPEELRDYSDRLLLNGPYGGKYIDYRYLQDQIRHLKLAMKGMFSVNAQNFRLSDIKRIQWGETCAKIFVEGIEKPLPLTNEGQIEALKTYFGDNESGRFFTNLDKEAKRNEETCKTWKE